MKEIINSLLQLFIRDLKKLRKEIEEYKDESKLWAVDKEINNSGGNLCLHTIGNLRHFVGAVLGQTGYLRDRHGEFNDKNIPREELYTGIDETITTVKHVLPKLDKQALLSDYPLEVFGHKMSTLYFLIHLQGHLNYHLGQINYHRRLLDI